VLSSKVGEKEIVIKELQKTINELSEREKMKENAFEKDKKIFEDQLGLKERELNRIQKEFKEEKSNLVQKICFAEKY